jgi:hypothetical protein
MNGDPPQRIPVVEYHDWEYNIEMPPAGLVFGRDTAKPMDRIERRRESWRRSSRKYRAIQSARKRQATLFGKEDDT